MNQDAIREVGEQCGDNENGKRTWKWKRHKQKKVVHVEDMTQGQAGQVGPEEDQTDRLGLGPKQRLLLVMANLPSSGLVNIGAPQLFLRRDAKSRVLKHFFFFKLVS